MERLSIDKVKRCKCDRFSCDSVTSQGEDGKYFINPDTRFRLVKDEGGAVTNQVIINGVSYKGGHTSNSIPGCEIRNEVPWYRYTYEDDSGKIQTLRVDNEKEKNKNKKRKTKKKKGR